MYIWFEYVDLLIDKIKTTVADSEFYVKYCSELFVVCIESSEY